MPAAAIAVFGAGSWGTTLAIVLARNGHRVQLWGQDAARVATMAHEQVNARYLPDIPFPKNLTVHSDLAAVARANEGALLATPSSAFRNTLLAVHRANPAAKIAWATKGLEPEGSRTLSDVARDILPTQPFAVISGPTFAREVAQDLPTALTVASAELRYAEEVAAWLRNRHMRVYTSADVTGVEIGGAVKNVMAIAAGISDGLGYGANARAALITRGLTEMTRLGVALGGNKETFMGLTGMGDLILTCTDDQSRNRQVGLGLGRGESLGAIVSRLGQVAEGIATAKEVFQLATRRGIEMPITEQVYRVLFEHTTPPQAVGALLQRDAKAE